MEQDYTVNQLIQYIYGESDLFDRLEIEHALAHDSDIQLTYKELKSSYRALPKVTFSPSKTSVQNILSYADSSNAIA